MKLLTIVTRTMNTRTMSSAALMLAAVLFAPAPGKTQQLQRGVSVKMAATSSAPSMPEADDADAWIVTVTENNDLYFGVDPVTPQGLLDAMKIRPRRAAHPPSPFSAAVRKPGDGREKSKSTLGPWAPLVLRLDSRPPKGSRTPGRDLPEPCLRRT